MTGGMNNTFKFISLTLSVYLDYALGHSIYNTNARCFQTSMGNCNWNQSTMPRIHGRPATTIRADSNDADSASTLLRISNINVQKADYLCLRRDISYDLPLRWIASQSGRRPFPCRATRSYWTGVRVFRPNPPRSAMTACTALQFERHFVQQLYSTRKVLFGLKATF
ncbi:MAG: hypothetical protein ACLRMJ_09955 [Alistipes finegoldii]